MPVTWSSTTSSDLVVNNLRGGGASDTSLRGQVGRAFETIYGVRLKVIKLKFRLKFLVSTLQSVGVFVLLFAGGIMVLNGSGNRHCGRLYQRLDRVLDPWRELIAFVRSTSAARVQFDLIEGALGEKL
jgi:hypothetical protein